jgi:hypothetical protein
MFSIGSEAAISISCSVFSDITLETGYIFKMNGGQMYLIDCLFYNVICWTNSIILTNPIHAKIISFSSVIFQNCKTQGADSAVITSDDAYDGNFLINECEFIDIVSEGINTTAANTWGGAVTTQILHSIQVLRNSRFVRCKSYGSPYGALSFDLDTSTEGYAVLENCIFDSCVGAGNVEWAALLKDNKVCGIHVRSCSFINTKAFNINPKEKSVHIINDCIFQNYHNTNVNI